MNVVVQDQKCGGKCGWYSAAVIFGLGKSVPELDALACIKSLHCQEPC
jgi:hypothetical protein